MWRRRWSKPCTRCSPPWCWCWAMWQPALVLVLGHVAARAALGRTAPLGRLRAVPHAVAGRPAVVTYDPAFLLRSQDAKAATWADLCRALALVRKAEGGASHAG